ncbi:S1/P1 nuclease [Sandarakinorhabdus sp. AAP62]|uniref:S1/P1 nuclease n=1 Tax=Sandarakinorhabdus sp. AAP62 TaxID=1248916 RepID=UPI0002F0797A|nr:S1/P1 nuclease [Sandarakinorhabdus sp. AAP62]
MSHRLIRALLPLALLVAQPAWAWSEFAHRLTGSIAWSQLAPAARAEVRRLLRAEARLDTPECRLASIEDASVWPDCVRGRYSERFAFSAPWHYQNISVCAPFDINAKCPNGDCVTAQIPRQQAILADRSRPAHERLQAFSFLVHFTGDMHQPLHLGDKGDLGGNQVRAGYGAKAFDRMNLHRIWDSDLAERALTEPPAITPPRITPAMRRAFTAEPAATRIAIWARDAWEISRTVAYPELQGYPDSCPIPSGERRTLPRGQVTPDYISKATPAVRDQVAKAGSRIALLVNEALAPGGRSR